MRNLLFAFAVLLISSVAIAQDGTTTVEVNAESSQVNWTGKKVTGQHTGTISIKEGSLMMNGEGELTGGEFVIDMSSIECTDLEGKSKASLEGHLSSDDFFDTANHATAKMSIARVKVNDDGTYTLLGMMTIKDVTQSVQFQASIGDGVATANITVDRTKFGIKYGSGSFFDDLKDKAIDDNFELQVNLVF